jgi:hypothetical protein
MSGKSPDEEGFWNEDLPNLASKAAEPGLVEQ